MPSQPCPQNPYWEIDKEDRPPADRLDEYAAENRSKRDPKRPGTGPGGYGLGAARGIGDGVAQQGKRGRQLQCRPQSLKQA
jgi:hypothetical protein